jgi:transposase-like protein
VSRPTKLTPARRRAVCEGIRAGLPLREAALAAGISERTLHRWREQGQQDDEGPYWQFWQRTREAEALAQADLAAVVRAAALAGDWRAALAMLGRRWPNNWAETSRHELTGRDGGPVEVDVPAIVALAIERADEAIQRAAGLS